MLVGLTIQKYHNIKPSLYTKIAKLATIDHFEFDPSIFDEHSDIKILEKIVKGKSVVFHAPYYTDWKYDLSSHLQKEKIETYFENINKYGRGLGVKAIVVHPPVDPQANLIYYYQNIEKIPFPVYLENLPNQNWKEFEKWFFEVKTKIQRPLGICFDIPHSIIANGLTKALDLPDNLVPFIHYIHISDLNGKTDCHWPFFNPEGIFPKRNFVKFLRSIKFNGIINMEIRPVGKKGIVNTLRSYFLIIRIINPGRYLLKILKFCLLFIPLMINTKKIL